MKRQILEQAKKLAQIGDQDNYEKAQQLLLDYLKDHRMDTEAWLLVARIECNSPLEYPDKIIEYAEHVLSYEPTNAYALLFLSYANYYLMGKIGDDTYVKLCLAKSSDPEVMAMIEIAKAQYFEHTNIRRYEEALKKSIEYSPYQQTNYEMLGKFYLKQGKIEKGKDLIRKGLRNIKKVFNDENIKEYDPTNIEDFLNYYYKGTDVMDWMYNDLKLLLERTNASN